MTTLREAAIQALEALVRASSYYDTYAEISALEAALAEEALQRFTDVNQEIEAALGCEHCNQPLYAAVKCSDYERGFVDGMSEQARRSVDRAVNAMVSSKAKPLTGQEYADIYEQCADWDDFARSMARAHGIK